MLCRGDSEGRLGRRPRRWLLGRRPAAAWVRGSSACLHGFASRDWSSLAGLVRAASLRRSCPCSFPTCRRRRPRTARSSPSDWQTSSPRAPRCSASRTCARGASAFSLSSLSRRRHGLTGARPRRAPTLEALLKLFLLPLPIARNTSAADEEVDVVDPEEAAGYQASFSKLGASERPRADPVAYVDEPRMWLAKGLEEASRREPGKVRLRPALFFFFFFFFSSRRGRLPETDWSRLGPALPPSPTTDSCATAAGQPRVCDTLCAVHAAARDRPRLSSSRVALSIFPPPLHAVTTLSFSSRPLHPHPLPQPLSIFPAFSRWQHLQPRKGTCAVSHSLAPVQLVLEASQRRGESDAGNYRDGKAGACEGDP